jgi:hypothetical protein
MPKPGDLVRISLKTDQAIEALQRVKRTADSPARGSQEVQEEQTKKRD